MARVPKPAKSEKFAHKLYIDEHKNILVVGGKKAKVLTNGCFDYIQFSEHHGAEENNNQFLADNLQLKLLRSKSNHFKFPDALTSNSQSATPPSRLLDRNTAFRKEWSGRIYSSEDDPNIKEGRSCNIY